ncbi:MAG: PIG-L deacetylase family protein [Terriglobales bacterium]
MVIAAHADDEAVGALGWAWAWEGEIAVAFLTDGAPARRWRPAGCKGRAGYRAQRKCEALAVWQGFAPRARLYFAPFADQTLSFRLEEAAAWLAAMTAKVRPQTVLTPAYEGGHPDHDAANLLTAGWAAQARVEVWEYALYTAQAGGVVPQNFPDEPQWRRRLCGGAAAAKQRALAGYTSQAETLRLFAPEAEAVRPLPQHDYRHPALPGPAVYELWGWPWRARALAERYAAFVDGARARCAC